MVSYFKHPCVKFSKPSLILAPLYSTDRQNKGKVLLDSFNSMKMELWTNVGLYIFTFGNIQISTTYRKGIHTEKKCFMKNKLTWKYPFPYTDLRATNGMAYAALLTTFSSSNKRPSITCQCHRVHFQITLNNDTLLRQNRCTTQLSQE